MRRATGNEQIHRHHGGRAIANFRMTDERPASNRAGTHGNDQLGRRKAGFGGQAASGGPRHDLSTVKYKPAPVLNARQSVIAPPTLDNAFRDAKRFGKLDDVQIPGGIRAVRMMLSRGRALVAGRG